MEKSDVSIKIDDMRFNFRVAAYIEYKDKVLLHNPPRVDFWNLVGGRIKIGEDSVQAIKREFMEEIGYEVKNLKLIEVCENFYNMDDIDNQELTFVFKIFVDENDPIVHKQDFGALDKPNVVYHWFDKAEIENIKCLPKLIYDLVKRDDDTFIHGIEQGGKYRRF